MGLRVEKGASVVTVGPVRVSTPRFAQDLRDKSCGSRRSTVSVPRAGDVFNGLAHYRPHYSNGQIMRLVRSRGSATTLPLSGLPRSGQRTFPPCEGNRVPRHHTLVPTIKH